MLRSLKAIEDYAVVATDGDIGKVVNFFLDDERWTIRYLVVETGGPLTWDGRLVLISPISFRQVDWLTRRFHLALTVEKVKNSPSIEMDKPVSRQHEAEYAHHYGYMHYWGYPGIWGVGGSPGLLAVGGAAEIPEQQTEKPTGDIHLRSAKEIRGYHIHGSDGEIGHVEEGGALIEAVAGEAVESLLALAGVLGRVVISVVAGALGKASDLEPGLA